MIVIRKCPYCKIVNNIPRIPYNFGAPFQTCSFCGRVFLLKDRNEWDIMSIAKKGSYVLQLIMAIIVWTIAITLIFVVIIYVIFEKLLGVVDDINSLEDSFTKTLLLISFIISTLGNFFLFTKKLNKSKERMKDEKYIQQLKGYGIKFKL